MSNTQQFQVGDFCWVELLTTNSKLASGFYQSLFPWQMNTVQAGEQDYTLIGNGQHEVAGLMDINDEMAKTGLKPCWNSYVQVEDVDAISEKAVKLGGSMIQPPFAIPGFGRMAVIADPTGGVFSLWHGENQAGETAGKTEPGMHSWQELVTPDKEAAQHFYQQLFNWQPEKQDNGYIMFKNNDKPVAGIMQADDFTNSDNVAQDFKNMPCAWNTYFSVNDCQTAFDTALKNGAKAVFNPVEHAGQFKIAMLQDTQDAIFGLCEPLT